MNPSHSIIILLISFLAVCTADRPPMGLPTANEKKSTKLPPCQSCTKLVESFKKGMIKTERGKHEGGDAAWEEQRLGSYKRSEVRLVDIQEGLCNDIIVGQDQCHALAETNEHLLEEWWFKEQGDTADIFLWLCVDKLRVCCPPNKFGPNCDDCSDCNGNGKCKGNGTRKGNGKCACDKGYRSELCNECDIEYYESFRDENKLLCSHCHHACDIGGCNTAGPGGCRVCKHGWSMQPEHGGCVDIDECATIQNTCTKNQFCVNSEGSYSCLECDKSCLGCNGDGPDLCDKCADGYELRDGLCKDMTNERREDYVTFTRYLTYLGLCIATCVIFQSSTWAASAVGLAVALYISVSEYWLHTNPSPTANNNGPRPLEDLFKDVAQLSEPVEPLDHLSDEL